MDGKGINPLPGIDRMLEEERRKSQLRYSRYKNITLLIAVPISILFMGFLIFFIVRAGIDHHHEKGAKSLIMFYGVIAILSLGVNVGGYRLLKRTKFNNTPYEKIADLIFAIATCAIITFAVNYFLR